MTTRPMIFQAESVRAIIAGTKTQTRRVLTRATAYMDGRWPSPVHWSLLDWESAWVDDGPSPAGNPGPYLHIRCNCEEGIWHRVYPRWQPRDRAWVREAWAQDVPGCARGVAYRADHRDPLGDGPAHPMTWRSPLYMPRWASRIVLRIVDVRLQRLHDISEADAVAEGCAGSEVATPREEYAVLWDEINGKRAPWKSNPWVIAMTFEKEDGRP